MTFGQSHGHQRTGQIQNNPYHRRCYCGQGGGKFNNIVGTFYKWPARMKTNEGRKVNQITRIAVTVPAKTACLVVFA